MGTYAITLLELLASKGHGVTLSPQRAVRVTHSSRLSKDLRQLIAACRSELTSQIASTVSSTVLEKFEVDENILHQQYFVHHLHCSSCISAGQSRSGLLRCTHGASLWESYCFSMVAPASTTRPKEPVKSHNLLRGQ